MLETNTRTTFEASKVKNKQSYYFTAFTLAEMMVVMLIASIILACMAPSITTKMKADAINAGGANASPWQFTQDNTGDAYFGINGLHTAIIGQQSREATDPNPKLLINSSNDAVEHITFKRGNNVAGFLNFTPNNGLLLGNLQAGYPLGSGAVGIGRNVAASGDNSVAIGNTVRTYILAQDTIALGNNIQAGEGIVIGSNHTISGNKVIMIGSDSNLEGFHHFADDGVYIGNNISPGGGASILIGAQASSSYNGYEVPVIAIGRGASVDSEGAIAIGANSYAGRHSISIGPVATSNTESGGNYNSIAIGAGAKNTSSYAISIGAGAEGSGIAIGVSAKSEGDIAIGWDAEASGSGSVAIGDRSTASGSGSVAFVATAKGPTSMALNHATTHEDAKKSTAIGFGAETFAEFSSALGTYAKAKGEKSTAMGYYANASGDCAVAIGLNALASGDYSVAIGKNSKAQDKDSIVLGTDYFTVHVPGTLKLSKSPVVSSDRRLKYVGKESTDGLAKIRQLKVFNYTFKKDETKTPHVGVIAQDLQKIFPNAVKKAQDGFLTIRMEDMFYAVINAIKELDAKYQAQEKRIKELEARIEKLETKIGTK